MTLADIRNAHTLAGSRYRAATEEFHAAFLNLAALDKTMANVNINPDGPHPVRTFGRLIERHELAHPVFLPHVEPHNAHDAVRAAHETHLSKLED